MSPHTKVGTETVSLYTFQSLTGEDTYVYIAFHEFIIIGFGDGAASNDSLGVRHVDMGFWLLSVVFDFCSGGLTLYKARRRCQKLCH
jgi:hypothetical protein